MKELPKTIGKRISTISSSRDIFESSNIEYENALKVSGYKDRLVYENSSMNENDKNEKKKRKCNIIWYNPPHSANVKTNIGKIFFKLLNKHFPRGHRFYKIFNKNTVKLSYSSTKNMASLIATHNRSILNPNDQVYGCTCRVRNDCPLQHKCLTPGIVYQVTVTNNKKKNRNETELSSYIWALKKDVIVHSIKWKKVRIVLGKSTSIYCRLCLTEKFFIINSIGDNRILNKRSEFVNKCRHQNKYLIKNVKLKDSID